MYTSDIEHAKNFGKLYPGGGFYENVTIPGWKAGEFLERFSKNSKEKEVRIKVILEGTEKYFEDIQKVKQEAKDACEINQKLNEVLESRIGIIQKLRGQEESDSKESADDKGNSIEFIGSKEERDKRIRRILDTYCKLIESVIAESK